MANVLEILIRLAKTGSGAVDAARDLKTVEAQAKSTADKLGAMGDKLRGIGSALTLGVTGPLMAAATLSVKAASDLAESTNKMQVVFGKASDSVQKFAQGSAKSLGMARTQAIEASSTFGNLFITMGVGQQKSAEMSTSLVQLASDLASFHNIDPSIALQKLQSGLVGESEPMRQLGVLLDEATVQQKAYQMGLANTGTELTQQQKVLARYALIMEQTKTAQGDFARTSDGLANSTRTAKAQLQDAAATMGTALIPFAITATKAITDLATAFASLDSGGQTTVLTLGAIAVAAGPVLTILGTLANVASVAIGAVTALAATLAGPLVIGLGLVSVGVLKLAADSDAALAKSQQAALKALKDPQAEAARLQERITNLKAELERTPMDLELIAQLQDAEAEAKRLQEYISTLKPTVDSAPIVDMAEKLRGAKGAAQELKTELASIKGETITITINGRQEQTTWKDPHTWWTGNNVPYTPDLGALPRRTRGQEGGLLGGGSVSTLPGPAADFMPGLPDYFKDASSAADKFFDKISKAFDRVANFVSSAIDTAMGKAKGLFDLTGTGGKGAMEPGGNGPFEALYRILDVAATQAGRAKGKDTDKWRAMYGDIDYTGISKAFQQGNVFAPGVFERIDWKQLGALSTQQDQANKVSTYAGQAVAGLMAAGKELTPENVKAMVDQLAAADKDNLVPTLTDIKTAVANMDTNVTGGSNLANVVAAIEALPRIPTTATQPPVPPTQPPVPATGPKPPPVPAYATGTAWHPGGYALVGEQGPELVKLPTGSRVATAQQTRQQGSGFMAGLVGAIGQGAGDMKEAGRILGQMLVANASNQVLGGMLSHFEGRL